MLEEVKNFKEAYKIIEESFPISEYRPLAIAEKLHEDKIIKMLGYYEDDLKGVVLIWEHKDYVFLENFAVARNARGDGVGSTILQAISELYKDTTIILEVEKPYDELSQRRIHFYERNGFILSDFGYMQPVINEEKNGIELLWMGYQKTFSKDEFEELKDSVMNYVYHKKYC